MKTVEVPEPGAQYGRLTVIASGLLPAYGTKAMYSLCECSCGKKCKVPTRKMLSGHVRSCACLLRDNRRELMRKIHERRKTA